MKFSYESRKTCGACRRELDAVRVVGDSDYQGLRISRHLLAQPGARGLCRGSLSAVERRP